MNINLDIINGVTYTHANFDTKLFVLWAYKILKYDKNYRFENINNQIDTFLFLCSLDYKVFEHDYSHICGINS
jgi:hypothetical protein